MFTTLAMVRIGKVRSNLMIDMNPTNVKLRDRAVRIVHALTGADYTAARASAAAQRVGHQNGSRAPKSAMKVCSPGNLPCRYEAVTRRTKPVTRTSSSEFIR